MAQETFWLLRAEVEGETYADVSFASDLAGAREDAVAFARDILRPVHADVKWGVFGPFSYEDDFLQAEQFGVI
jgi:hypothetical protein